MFFIGGFDVGLFLVVIIFFGFGVCWLKQDGGKVGQRKRNNDKEKDK